MRKKLVGIILVSSLFLIITSLLTVSIFLFIFNFNTPELNHASGTTSFRHLKYHLDTKTFQFSLATLPKHFQSEYFYEDDSGPRINLISSFSTGNEFVCSGSCFCSSQRRTSATTGTFLSRGLTFLVAAFTTSIAVDKAHEYFEGECKSRFQGECEEEDIQVVDDYCDVVSESVDENEESALPEEETKEEQTDGSETKEGDEKEAKLSKFLCQALCVVRDLTNDDFKEYKFFGGTLTFEAKIKFIYERSKGKDWCQRKSLEKVIEAEDMGRAVANFLFNYMDPYCKSWRFGRKGFERQIDSAWENLKGQFYDRKDGSMWYTPLCGGYVWTIFGERFRNPTVRCRAQEKVDLRNQEE